MEMTQANAWWIACGALIAVEMTTGTFYLLMLALGCAAGAGAAYLGLSGSQQIFTAALIGGVAVVVCRKLRNQRASPLPADANADVHIDIGQSVQVEQWNADGTATVKYRGAQWQARFRGNSSPAPGRHVIRAIEGSCLMLDA
ncbi:NfeD family protein [Paucibacter sp. AS339]|uniref:NfeD family protein n=1 Tax=Paucibacter hankyongi TaxID=3133434 RepID=UPI0030982EB7